MRPELELPETGEMRSDLSIDNQATLLRVVEELHAELAGHVLACSLCQRAMPLIRPTERQKRFYVVQKRCPAGLVTWRRWRVAVDRLHAVERLRAHRLEPRWGVGAIASWTQDVADGLARAIAIRKRRRFDVRALARDDADNSPPALAGRGRRHSVANNQTTSPFRAGL